MSQQEFTDHIDGLINDYDNGAIDGTEFRTGIMDTIITLARPGEAKPRFERKEIPMFSTIKTFAEFRQIVDGITDVDDLNTLRNVILGYKRRNDPHPLKEAVYDYAACFSKLNARAEELGFTRLSAGYRAPIKN